MRYSNAWSEFEYGTALRNLARIYLRIKKYNIIEFCMKSTSWNIAAATHCGT